MSRVTVMRPKRAEYWKEPSGPRGLLAPIMHQGVWPRPFRWGASCLSAQSRYWSTGAIDARFGPMEAPAPEPRLVLVFSGKRKSGKDFVTDLILERCVDPERGRARAGGVRTGREVREVGAVRTVRTGSDGSGGSEWVRMDLIRFERVRMGSDGSNSPRIGPNWPRRVQMGPNRSECVRMGSNGSGWVRFDLNGRRRVRMSPNGSDSV